MDIYLLQKTGCFWGLQLAFQRVPGVIRTEVGYTRGRTFDPTYESVCKGDTGHVEAVKVEYDENLIPFHLLLDFYWCIIDPTSLNKQGTDEGEQYRTGMYFSTREQELLAKEAKAQLTAAHNKEVMTEILSATTSIWYRAEEYHQRYLEKGGQCAFSGTTTPIRCYGMFLFVLISL